MKNGLRLTVAARLYVGFAAVCLGVLLITAVSLSSMQTIQYRLDIIVDDVAPAEEAVAGLQVESVNLARLVSNFFNERDVDALERIQADYESAKRLYRTHGERVTAQLSRIEYDGIEQVAEQLQAMEASLNELLETVETSMAAYQRNLNDLQLIEQKRQEVIELNEQLSVALDIFVRESFDPAAKELAYETKSLVERGGSLALQMTFASNLSDFQAAQELFREFSDDYGALGFRMLGFARNDAFFQENMQEVASLTSTLVEAVTVSDGIGPIQNQYLQLRASLSSRLEEIQQQLNSNVSSLNDIAAQMTLVSRNASDEAHDSRETAQLTLIASVLIIILVSVGISVLVVQSIRRPLKKLRSFIQKVGHGDLTTTMDRYGNDEIGDISRAMDQLVGELREVVLDIAAQSQRVNDVANRTSELAEQTQVKTGQQQQEVAQSVHSIGEMSESIKEVARTAEHTSQEMQAGEAEAGKINQGISQTVSSIADLNSRMQGAVDVIHNLDQGVASIESILETIQNIAEQTNLLALNAAIEAARAGEQGRGFAVVADEVRTLANRTQSSTEEIRAKIDSIQGQSTEAVSTISLSRDTTENVAKTAQDSGDKFNAFMTQMQSLSSANVSIAAAAEEQSATTEEMSRLMQAIGELTTETTQIVQQVADGVHSLSSVATDLDKAVHRFRTGP
ncbi:methyl-accepting chemotaxis protein [Reinekea blandensis]|nr:methyl-accepting chemotaxis protein [Reinekea blandensis]